MIMSKPFLDQKFLLHSPAAERLYHEYAANMPIIDYHCHLSPEWMAKDHRFPNLTAAWLHGDHYKWRAMRANGVDESYCTGQQPDKDKFYQWAKTVPATLRNPLYHWTHLELQRYFGIHELLNPSTADDIYANATAQLQMSGNSTMGLLQKMKVEVVVTTDDPIDNLEWHKQMAQDNAFTKVLPAFRPDRAMDVSSPASFLHYLQQLETVSACTISSFEDYLYALQNRHDYFAAMGCKLSDHGLEEIYADDFTGREVEAIFTKIKEGKELNGVEQRKFKSCMLLHFAEWDWEKGWVQQFHLGALRNNNGRMMQSLGPDTGWDSIGDFKQAVPLSKFLNKLDLDNKLARTILYNLNPADNELMATMVGNFNDGSVAGKIQMGSAWWFLDQKEGIEKQLNALSNMGLLSRFVGMLTDSRSFLSYPRHEYFRRILCNLLGQEITQGELPADYSLIGNMVQDICYHNAKTYFNF
jgi:glucuronate isomerase